MLYIRQLQKPLVEEKIKIIFFFMVGRWGYLLDCMSEHAVKVATSQGYSLEA